MPSADLTMTLPQIEQSLAEEAAARFADREDDAAISLLMAHLKEHGKASASHRPWQLLMDIYQARADQASFEKLASMFAGRFNTSPPSWRRTGSSRPAQGLGRNVLIVTGLPSGISAEKRRDFLASSRDQAFCRLDLSRLDLPSDPDAFAIEAEILLSLLDRMTRLRLKVMLMGEGQTTQVLRQAVDNAQWPDAALQAAWRLLLVLMQWRGQHVEFDQRAMAFADRFDLSPPGYEEDAVLALDSPGQGDDQQIDVLDEAGMQAQCENLRLQYEQRGSAQWDLGKIFRITYPAAMALSACLVRAGFDPRRVEFSHPSEMVVALFDTTGVSPQVNYTGRGR